MNGKRIFLYGVLLGCMLLTAALVVAGCGKDGEINSVLLPRTPDANDPPTAFVVAGVAVHRYYDKRSGVYCWVFRDSFYPSGTTMSCLPEAQVTPAPAVIWTQP